MNAHLARRNAETYCSRTKAPGESPDRNQVFAEISKYSTMGFSNIIIQRNNKLYPEDIKELINLEYRVEEFDIKDRKSHTQYSVSW